MGLVDNLATEDMRKIYWKAFDNSRERFIKRFKRRIGEAFDDERKGLTRAIRGSQGVSGIDDEVDKLIKGSDNIDKWYNVYVDLWADVVKYYGTNIFDDLIKARGEFNLTAVEIQEYIARVTAQHVRYVTDTTKKEVSRKVGQGVQDGSSIPKIAKAIDELYLEQIIPYRSVVIARTETVGASNYGSLMGARQADVGVYKKWLATADDRVRDTHADAEMHPAIALNEYFVVGGTAMQFPGDPSGGSESINCRCAIYYTRTRG